MRLRPVMRIGSIIPGLLAASVLALSPVPAGATEFSGPRKMVIVTPDDQVPAWQRLADFKTTIGVPTEVVTLSAIFAGYSGADVPATIRAYLQAAHAAGAEFALLAGDAAQIPVRLARTLFFGGNELPTDLYYSDLDGTWDADGVQSSFQCLLGPSRLGFARIQQSLLPHPGSKIWLAIAPTQF